MLASFFQFGFLCVVALANLCLGFVIASRLGFGPSISALFELEPRLRSASGEAHETVEVSDLPAEDSGDIEQADEAECRESYAPAPEEPIAVVECEDPIEVVCDLLQGYCESLDDLRNRLTPEDSSLTSSEAEAMAEELTESTQGVLQKLSACTDSIKRSADAEAESPETESPETESPETESPETEGADSEVAGSVNQFTTELSELQSKVNDGLAQLALLNYDDDSLSDAAATLKTTIDEITGLCDATKNQVEELVTTV